MAHNPRDKEKEDLNRFLSKVDDIESIVKGLHSQDLSEQNDAISRADDLIKKETRTVHDKTVINKNAYDNDRPVQPDVDMTFSSPETSQDAFLKALEVDANRRAAARKERHRKANEIKDKANIEFRDGNYEAAMQLYSEAIEIAKDLAHLHTNRGMTHIKMGQYQNAVDDSNQALRADPTWIKAFIVKGNALRFMKKHDDAISTYKEILQHSKGKEKLVDGYVKQVEEQKKVEELEMQAKRDVEDKVPAAEGIAKLIRTIGTRLEVRHESKENMHIFYAGGFQLLAAQLIDDQSRTLFRTEGGFKLLEAKPYLRDVLLKRTFSFGQQSDFAHAVLICLRAACTQCPQNTTTLFNEHLMPEVLMNLLESDDKQVKHAAITCFHEFASNDKMVEMISELYKAPKIVSVLLGKETIKLKLLEEAIRCLQRFAENKRFRQDIVQEFDSLVLQIFQKFIDEIKHNQRKELPKCLHCLFTFTTNKPIYQMVATNMGFWESCLTCIDRCVHIMEPSAYRNEVLSRMFDVTEALMLQKSSVTIQVAPRLAQIVLPVMNGTNDELTLKALVVLTRTLERAKESVKSLNSSGLVFIKKIYKLIKSDDHLTRTHALKVICHCGQNDPTTLKNVAKFDKKYNVIRKVLKTDDTEIDVINQGHAAILLGFLSQLPGGMDPLVDYNDESSNVVKHLLDLCRYSKNSNTRYNCVIALGKMANSDGRILGELRRFDGINILARNKPPTV